MDISGKSPVNNRGKVDKLGQQEESGQAGIKEVRGCVEEQRAEALRMVGTEGYLRGR